MTNDTEILDLCKREPERGFRMLMEVYGKSIYWSVRRLVVVHEDAEDVTQEAFIRVWSALPQFRGECALRTWIFRVATNEALRFLDRSKTASADEGDMQQELIEKLQASSYVDFDDAMAVKFQEALLRLPKKQRLVFNLRYYDELDYQSIATITGDVVSTLKVNYHLAKEKIKEWMSQ